MTTTVLFDREIVRILDKHCVMCHFENGPAFPLETYEQTWLKARKMRADAIAREMPPWSAFPGYGHFANDNGLTLRETQFIVSWVEGSGPRNAGTVFTNTGAASETSRKEVRAHIDPGHWELGEPQLKKQLPPNEIEAQAPGEVKRVTIDLGLTAERRVGAIEFLPGDRRVVRAAFFTVMETGQWLGGWTPWYTSLKLPAGVAWRLPAGSHIVAEIHYRGTLEKVSDRGTIGLFFANEPQSKTASDLVLESKGDVAAGSVSQKFQASQKLAADTNLVALRVDCQPGVDSIELAGRKPDGTSDVMLFVKNVRFDWPTPYVYKDPVSLPKGTELRLTAHYSNRDQSPHSGGIRLVATSYQSPSARK